MMLNKTFHLILLSLIPIFGFSQANSQYPDSGNKIRLGFQTTGDGLIWRDTQPKVGGYQPINNKAAWIILDTINNKFYHYKDSTWTLAGGQDIDTANLIATKYNLGFKLSLADTQNMLSPYWQSGRFSGVLPLLNGGTGATTLAAALINTGSGTLNYLPKYTATGTGTTLGNSSIVDNGGSISSTSSVTFDGVIAGKNTLTIGNGTTAANSSFSLLGVPNVSYTWSILNNANGLSFSPGTTVLKLNGDTGAATFSSSVTATTGTFSAVGAGAYANDLNITSTGVLTTASSDEKYKYNILPINYGLNTILQLKPVNFQWIKGEENDLGFIAQDVADIIPEAVDTNWNSDLLMRYESIIPILTKAIQEQQSLIKALEQRILNLENK